MLGIWHSPSSNRPSLGQVAVARCPFLWGAGGASVETCHEPQSARSCKLALCAAGAAKGHHGGGAPRLLEGCPGPGTLLLPNAHTWDRRPGPAACFPAGRRLGAWGPVTNPTWHTPASCRCALWGQQEGTRWWASRSFVRGFQILGFSLLQLPVLGAGGRGPLPVFLVRRD